MREVHMDLRQLRNLVALAEHGGFVRAADAVNLSQPAFSRSIQTLERDLGCRLVDREARELRLTGQGRLVLEHARRLLAGARALSNEVAQYNGLDVGSLVFGCGPAPAIQLVPDAIAGFIDRYPKIALDFRVDNWERLAELLKVEEIEFFVGDIRPFVHDPAYQVQALRERRGCFFCRPGHPLAGPAPVTLAELLRYPLLGPRLPLEMRRGMAQLTGCDVFVASLECEHFSSLLRIVEQSDAIGMAPAYALQERVAAGALQPLRLRELAQAPASLRLRYGLVARAGRALSPAAEAMFEALLEADRRTPEPAA
jgi:DNA-binding transcriptional LysR family regulator